MALIISALLFSIASNLDNLVVGIAYGIKKVNIGIVPNLIIAIINTLGTFLSMEVGKYILRFLPSKFANYIGACVIIILGIYFIIDSILELIKKKENRNNSLKHMKDIISSKHNNYNSNEEKIGLTETFMVAFALTFNNLGTGVAASVTGVSINLTVIMTFILSILAIGLGENLGDHVIGKFFGQYASLISGILLVMLGFFELIG